MKKILIITSPRDPKWLESSSDIARGLLSFAADISDKTMSVHITTLDRLIFTISAHTMGVWDDYNGRDLLEYDAIHMRNLDKDINSLDYARAIYAYATHHAVHVVEEADRGGAYGKLSQMVLFHLAGLPVPHTVASWSGSVLIRKTNTLSMPLIVKANNAMKGEYNYKITSHDELVGKIAMSPQSFVAQEFVPNNGDYRVLFIGEYSDPLIFKRSSIDGSHLNNTSKGAQVERVAMSDFPKEALEMCVKAAVTVGRKVTGVDVMQDVRDGSWVLLEANANPALSMGEFLQEKRHMYRSMLETIFEERT